MANLWSCHLIINRKLPDDRKHVHDLIDADLFGEEVVLFLCLNGLHPQTLTFFLTITLMLGKC